MAVEASSPKVNARICLTVIVAPTDLCDGIAAEALQLVNDYRCATVTFFGEL
jgi:hypothetical protein